MSVGSETVEKDGTVPGTVFTPRQVRVLKWVVIGLGIALVLCFALVIVTIVYQASHLGETRVPAGDRAAAPAPAPAHGGAAVSASAPTVALGAGAGRSVAGVTLDGDRLAVHLKGPDGEEIAIVDIASGSVVRRIEVTPQR
jgi:hypothetical protein